MRCIIDCEDEAAVEDYSTTKTASKASYAC